MNPRSLLVFLLIGLSLIIGVSAGSAEEVQPLEPQWLSQMYEEGWQKVQEGVLRRDLGEGRTENFSYGAEGFQWLIEKYNQRLAYFEGEYRESPSDELASLINRLKDKVNALQDEALTAPAAKSFDVADALQFDAADAVQTEGCNSYDLTFDAGPKTSTQGVEASASASFNSACGITGSTFASAWAKAAVGTVVTDQEQHDQKDNGTQLVSQAYASMNGSLECESIAMASVTFLDKTYSADDMNTDCPDVVSIAGPTQVATDYYGQACADVTWTATTASGRTDYTFEWYIGTTLAKRYCNEATSVTPRVVASNGAGWSDDATFTTDIQYTPPVVASVSGPVTVTTDYYSSPCATVTWTASATGGHPGSGYTYNWYIGTSPTVQGTGSTFSKTYCNTSQVVTVKAIAQDSDGHTANATLPTSIQYTGPVVTSSISGPASVTTDYYTSACANVTWTAGTTTGGHPGGYTYSWYLDTDPTVQGTGSTFTKSYCNTSQSVAVKAVASDSDGHTAEAPPFTTVISYKGVIATRITGPTSTSSATSCTTVSWTVGATSTGHSGFTYKWYIGTTLQTSTSTTFSKQFCASQSVTVKATATASDGHQDTDTHTTSITITPAPPPLTASISGPASVQLTTSTECKSITWTASATGGTPGYTYSWYIGTSTTVQGTAATLTKSYCGPQTINVKVVARDSTAQTDDATFTTTLMGPTTPPLAASINGPSDVYALKCPSATWTASVSGGTPPYSYSWTIDTSTTVLSTTSSLTRSFCTSEYVDVKLTVRDSASHTATATFTTSFGSSLQ